MAYTPPRQFWYFIHLLGWKDRVLELLSDYRATNIKELSVELQEQLVNKVRNEWNERCKRPRGAVIHYLCIMPGYSFTTGDKPNYEAIDGWTNQMFGKRLNQLSLSELNTAVSAVKKWYDKELKSKQGYVSK